jgi:hypothetical protein
MPKIFVSILFFFFFATLEFSPTLVQAIELDDLVLVHCTNVKPSISEDGKSLVMKTGGSKVSILMEDDGKSSEIKRSFSKPHRATLHWSLNGVTSVLGAEISGKFVYGMPAKYVVLEPISYLKDSLWGGIFDDLYSIGDHTISSSAFLLVREEDPDIDKFKRFVPIITVSGFKENSTNDDFRGVVSKSLKLIGKPRMGLNGLPMDEALLSKVWKVDVPPSWKDISDEVLAQAPEFIKFNKQNLQSLISGIARFDDTRLFFCKECRGSEEFPSVAVFRKSSQSLEAISREMFKDILDGSSFRLPEFGKTHSSSRMIDFENNLQKSYKEAPEKTVALADELQAYVDAEYAKTEKTPPKGFYTFIDRVKKAREADTAESSGN